MKLAGVKSFSERLPVLLAAVAYGIVMLMLNEPEGLHDTSPYHRLQADALLRGRFALSSSIEALHPGLVWHDGGVQQVWGLGVGLWLVPFQIVGHLFGGVFSERLALGCAFMLLGLYAITTGLRLINSGRKVFGTGVIWLIILCPALWTLSRVSDLVFEETTLYALLVSLGILVSLLRMVLFRSRSDYVLCCVLCAYTVWVRPTHGIYGFCGVLMAGLTVWFQDRNRWRAVAGVLSWFISLGLLAWTNFVRFGSVSEFGHHLTVSTSGMMYLTRFGNPFDKASVWEAGKELFGLLFLQFDVRGAGAFSDNLFVGQASFTRWRRLELSAFDPSYLLLCLASVFIVIREIVQRGTKVSKNGNNLLIWGLMLWSVGGFVGLAGFYLYFPAIASRYLLDFAPAFVGLAVVCWSQIPEARPWFWLSILSIWLCCEIAFAKTPLPERTIRNDFDAVRSLPLANGRDVSTYQGFYNLSRHPFETGIEGNGSGWDRDDGFAAPVISLVIDKPRFIELNVSERRMQNGEEPKSDNYRAQIDGYRLPLQRVQKDGMGGVEVIFGVPESIRDRQLDEVLFLCFTQEYDQQDRESQRILHSVKWR
ncbi:MAG TPA: hypothetical protein VK327_11610 [Candidatus Paceibacterota bacterium]|nr:hypothetical protein [Candidatus Paceibacterota bacterium]